MAQDVKQNRRAATGSRVPGEVKDPLSQTDQSPGREQKTLYRPFYGGSKQLKSSHGPHQETLHSRKRGNRGTHQSQHKRGQHREQLSGILVLQHVDKVKREDSKRLGERKRNLVAPQHVFDMPEAKHQERNGYKEKDRERGMMLEVPSEGEEQNNRGNQEADLHEGYEVPLIRKKDVHPEHVHVVDSGTERQEYREAKSKPDYEAGDLLNRGCLGVL